MSTRLTTELPAGRGAEPVYTLREAAEIKKVSQDLLRKAIKATEGPILRAKLVGKGYRVSASALDAWWDSLEDA